MRQETNTWTNSKIKRRRNPKSCYIPKQGRSYHWGNSPHLIGFAHKTVGTIKQARRCFLRSRPKTPAPSTLVQAYPIDCGEAVRPKVLLVHSRPIFGNSREGRLEINYDLDPLRVASSSYSADSVMDISIDPLLPSSSPMSSVNAISGLYGLTTESGSPNAKCYSRNPSKCLVKRNKEVTVLAWLLEDGEQSENEGGIASKMDEIKPHKHKVPRNHSYV